MKRRGMMVAGGLILGLLPIIGLVFFIVTLLFWTMGTVTQGM